VFKAGVASGFSPAQLPSSSSSIGGTIQCKNFDALRADISGDAHGTASIRSVIFVMICDNSNMNFKFRGGNHGD
jgi:hypothetical protein